MWRAIVQRLLDGFGGALTAAGGAIVLYWALALLDVLKAPATFLEVFRELPSQPLPAAAQLVYSTWLAFAYFAAGLGILQRESWGRTFAVLVWSVQLVVAEGLLLYYWFKLRAPLDHLGLAVECAVLGLAIWLFTRPAIKGHFPN